MKEIKLDKERKLELFQAFLEKDWFKLDVWEDQNIDWPGDAVIHRMEKEVRTFMAFIIDRVEQNSTSLFDDIQEYFNVWDTEEFENEQVELIVEALYEPMVIAGIDIDEVII
ncbi:MAG: hypothetical protein ACK4UP_06090 [Spirosomataceae bacterium]